MTSSMNDMAEIEAVSIVNSFDETVPRTQTAASFDLQATDSTRAHEQAASSRWTTVWQALTNAWDVADEHLANFFGLNESKYEWAVREYYYQKRVEQEEANLALEQEERHLSNQTKELDSEHAAAQSGALNGNAMV